MSKHERCLSFDRLVAEAKASPNPESWGVEQVESAIALETVFEVCRRLFSTGHAELAQQIFEGRPFMEKVVVPDSRQLPDQAYTSVIPPHGCMTESDHSIAMTYLGVPREAA